jgi:hypothetical protein
VGRQVGDVSGATIDAIPQSQPFSLPEDRQVHCVLYLSCSALFPLFSPVSPVLVAPLTPPSRLWLLTTLMALYTLHVRTIPSLRRRLLSDAPTGETIVHPSQPERESRKALNDAEWTNRKLLADLVFVCECGVSSAIPSPGP